MNTKSILIAVASAATLALAPSCATNNHSQAKTGSAAQISHDSRAALHSLYAQNSNARALGHKAKSVLVFPAVVKGGFVFAGEAGNGAMIRHDGTIGGYYQTAGASYGFQAGIQQYGYALFFMDNAALRNLDNTSGWEVGSTPNLVVLNKGMSSSLSTTTAQKGVYAAIFDQRGLMGGIDIGGAKISRIHPNP